MSYISGSKYLFLPTNWGLREQNIPKNSCQSYDSKFCFLVGVDLSKEVLWIYVDQRAAKLQAVKIGDLKKICHLVHCALTENGPG